MGCHGEAGFRPGGEPAMIIRTRCVSLGLLGFLVLLAAARTGAAQTQDDVRKALVAGAYDRAVSLALNVLRVNPADDEVRFLLARAYAYSGRRDEAASILRELLAAHPDDADLLVFKGRLLSWNSDLEGAEAAFRRALELRPRSADALAGLADLAAWRGDGDTSLAYCRRALDLDANHAGALFRTGSVLMWRGDYGRARGYLARAAELEPLNKDFARALAAAAPVFARKTEIWLSGRNEHWSDGRADYRDLGLSGLFSLFGDRARIVVKAERLWRADAADNRAGLEIYPQLWKGAYGYVDISLAPKADFAARSSFHFEIYQSVLKKLELSAGARRMSFATGGVTVLAGSAAVYAGAWYPSFRVHWADSGTRSDFTWMAGLRRYLTGANYLWFTAGRGSRSMETAAAEEILTGPAWFGEAGFDLYVLRDIKLRGYVSRRQEKEGPSSTAIALVAGYRF
jgi:YaiO family outer membrane protein